MPASKPAAQRSRSEIISFHAPAHSVRQSVKRDAGVRAPRRRGVCVSQRYAAGFWVRQPACLSSEKPLSEVRGSGAPKGAPCIEPHRVRVRCALRSGRALACRRSTTASCRCRGRAFRGWREAVLRQRTSRSGSYCPRADPRHRPSARPCEGRTRGAPYSRTRFARRLADLGPRSRSPHLQQPLPGLLRLANASGRRPLASRVGSDLVYIPTGVKDLFPAESKPAPSGHAVAGIERSEMRERSARG